MSPVLQLQSQSYLFSEWIPFRARVLAPGQVVTLELEHVDDVGQRWLASAVLSADADGVVDTADAPSRGGSYLGVSRDGLLWSMAPVGVTDRAAFMAEGRSDMHMVGQPGRDRLHLRQHTLRLVHEGRVLAEQGGSRGGELTLVLASYRPDLFCGGVAMVPFHNVVAGFDHLHSVHEGPRWVLDGEPLQYAACA